MCDGLGEECAALNYTLGQARCSLSERSARQWITTTSANNRRCEPQGKNRATSERPVGRAAHGDRFSRRVEAEKPSVRDSCGTAMCFP